jgi:hypothetical protein
MSKRISYKGKITPGADGKTGYRIKKFQIMPTRPGVETFEYVFQVFATDTATSSTIDFTNPDILAVAYYADSAGSQNGFEVTTIFDNEVFNQDIFITGADAHGGVDPCNYYLEVETLSLSDVQATQLTLKSLRNISA